MCCPITFSTLIAPGQGEVACKTQRIEYRTSLYAPGILAFCNDGTKVMGFGAEGRRFKGLWLYLNQYPRMTRGVMSFNVYSQIDGSVAY